MYVRPHRLVGSVRNRVGSRRRRSYATWAPMPDRPAAGSSWWADAPWWFPQGTPPRRDTSVEVLIDGEETFRTVWEAIKRARRSVWLVDWSMSITMPLVRGEDLIALPPADGAQGTGYRVFDLLTEASQHLDVRVLLWSGSLLFRPRTRVAVRQLRTLRAADSRIQGVVEKHPHRTHCHHQKTVVVDGRLAFVGGLDMTDFDIDRWDTSAHPVRAGLNWHDLCLRLEGSAAIDVAHNFAQRWHAVTGETVSLPEIESDLERPNAVPVQVVRTIPKNTYDFAPDGEFGIAWAYRQALRAARHLIYIENQYLWSPAVAAELLAALERVKDPAFRIVLVLPARPNIGKRDSDIHIRALREADQGRGRVHVFSLYTAGQDEKKGWEYKPIYVHAKVGIVDDLWCTVGSANLNGRGMEGDSEINAQFVDEARVRDLRLRLWAEHLALPRETIAGLDSSRAIDQLWVPLAHHGRTLIDRRQGPLRASVIPYETGDMPHDLSIGELEARLLDQ